MAPIKIAIFGNGFAKSVVLPCLRHVPSFEVVGIASPTLKRVRETAAEYGIPHCSSDHREILAQKPDVVFVVTPPHRHLDQSRDALEAGAHVICEKPTALNRLESLELLELSRERPKQLALVDHELRFDPRRIRLRELIEQGELGTIRHIAYHLHSTAFSTPQAWSWWSDRERGGGALGAIGSHAVDALRVWLGEIRELTGSVRTLVDRQPDPTLGEDRVVTSDHLFNAELEFKSGAVGTLTVSLVESDRKHEVTIAGTRGGARLIEQGPLLFAKAGESPREVDWVDSLAPNAALEIPDTDWARNFLRFAKTLARYLNGEENNLALAANFEDGHRNQCVLDAIRESSQAKAWTQVRY